MLLASIEYVLQLRPFCFHILQHKTPSWNEKKKKTKLKTSSLMCLHFQLQNIYANINSKSPVAFCSPKAFKRKFSEKQIYFPLNIWTISSNLNSAYLCFKFNVHDTCYFPFQMLYHNNYLLSAIWILIDYFWI